MRLTNLYNYVGVHTFSTKNHINLDCVPVISNTGYDEEPQEEFLQQEYSTLPRKIELI